MNIDDILISGPNSFYILELDGIKYYLVGDQHNSASIGACQRTSNVKCDSINYTFDGVNVTNDNCWSIGSLLIEWFEYNYSNSITTDFYLEVPFTKSKNRSRIRQKLNDVNLRQSNKTSTK